MNLASQFIALELKVLLLAFSFDQDADIIELAHDRIDIGAIRFLLLSRGWDHGVKPAENPQKLFVGQPIESLFRDFFLACHASPE